MKCLIVVVLGIMASGCASTMEKANIECNRGRIAAFQDEDFKMACQEHSIKEFRGLPQAPPQVIYIQAPAQQQQPQVVYIQHNPQYLPQVNSSSNKVEEADEFVGYQPDVGGPGAGGRNIISRVGQ